MLTLNIYVMRNLFLFTAALLSITVTAQEELARIQVIFSDGPWTEARRDSLSWEVWAEPANKCTCFDWAETREEKAHITDEYIAQEIEKNREAVSEYNDEFVLWYSVKRQGIYHINVRNKYTGELMGQNMVMYKNGDHHDFGWVAYDHDWLLLQLDIDEGELRPYANCWEERYGPLGWDLN